jgi:hypothetical protein
MIVDIHDAATGTGITIVEDVAGHALVPALHPDSTVVMTVIVETAGTVAIVASAVIPVMAAVAEMMPAPAHAKPLPPRQPKMSVIDVRFSASNLQTVCEALN